MDALLKGLIGHGSAGQVYRGLLRGEQAVAVKIYNNRTDAARRALQREVEQMRSDTQRQLAELAAFAVAGYAQTRNFTLLHAVTGLRALRVLSHWCGPLDASPVLVHALTAAYLAAQVPARSVLPAPRLQTWLEVIAAACASDDDHVIKIVHACWEESHAYGPGRYLEAAALAVA